MKATGEVMAIGQSFEQGIMKAVRGAEISADTLNMPPLTDEPLEKRLHDANDRRLFTLFEALKSGYTVESLHEITKIDEWFLYKLQKPHKDNDFSPNRTNAKCKKEKSTLFLGENHGFDTDAVVSVWNFSTSSSTGLDISPSFPIGKAPDEECMR